MQLVEEVKKYFNPIIESIKVKNNINGWLENRSQQIQDKIERLILASQIDIQPKSAYLCLVNREQQEKNSQSKLTVIFNQRRNKNKFSLKVATKKQENQRIKSILQTMKKYQQNLYNKEHQRIEQQQKWKSLEKQMKRQQLQEARIHRKQYSQANLQKHISEFKIRKNQQKQGDQRLKEIKQQKYMYKLKILSDLEKQKLSVKQFEDNLRKVKERLKFNMRTLTEQSQRYDKQKEKKNNKRRSFSINKETKLYENNYFRQLMFRTQAQSQEKKKLMLNQSKEKKDRLNAFYKKLKNQYKPLVSHKNSVVREKRSQVLSSLSFEQRKKKGLQYLKKAKQLKDMEKQMQRIKLSAQSISTEKPRHYSLYTDYSKSLKKQSNPQKYLKTQFETSDRTKQSITQILHKDSMLLKSIQEKLTLLQKYKNK